jgi:hypothetical protein
MLGQLGVNWLPGSPGGSLALKLGLGDRGLLDLVGD